MSTPVTAWAYAQRFRWVAITCWLALLALNGGCFASDNSSAEPSAQICSDDQDCEAGTCQFGICAAPVDSQLSISLVLEPPAFRADLSALHVTQLPVSLGSSLPDFALRAPTPVRGVVLFNATVDGVGSPVEAELRFRSVSGVDGFEYEASTRSEFGTGEYEIALPPGTYDVSIEPNRADVSRTTAFGVEIGLTEEFRPFNLPAPSQYAVISGVLEREANGTSYVANAKVFARSVDGRHESTVDITDETGAFIVLVPPTSSLYQFQVRATADSEWVPTAAFEGIEVTEDWSGAPLRLALGELGEPIPISLRIETPDGARVTDATINLRSDMDAREGRADAPGMVSGRYERRLDGPEIDADGNATVLVPPGRTEIYAAALDGTLGIGVPVVISVRSGEISGEPVRVTVEQRHVVRGSVVGAENGEGVEDVVIEASLRTTDLLPLERYNVPSTAFGAATETGEGGGYGFQVQPGVWDIDVIPPAGSGYARTRVVLDMARGVRSGFDIELPRSGVVQGRLLDDEDAPLAGATVRAFIPSEGGVLALGAAVTDALGVYRIVLPAQDEVDAMSAAAAMAAP